MMTLGGELNMALERMESHADTLRLTIKKRTTNPAIRNLTLDHIE
jgi:hypothetical protein